ncbi:MAG: NFACT family protein, partial [Candidatus Gastranaerophilaceae bacterium]
MINFDSLTLKAQLKEIVPILKDGRIQKVQQISRRELLFSIRASGKSHKFYVSIHPSYAHCALLSPDGEKLRLLEVPQKPPMFCMLLRKYMEGARITDILQPPSERIIEFCFDSYNEMGERIPLILAIELMGKHSNIILY